MISLPSLFLAHGAPDLILSDHPAKEFLTGFSSQLPRPKSILIVSAHWQSGIPTLTTAEAPQTVYDFSGWPQQLYSLQYPAKTDVDLIERTRALLRGAGIVAREDEKRGYDHGTWVPLLLAYPKADVPVVQLSLQQDGSARRHFEIGQALSPLRDEGVLIIGSGVATHNLGSMAPEGTLAPNWAKDFDQWLDNNIQARNLEHLLEFPNTPAEARRAHPTPEHLMPIFVAMGAGWSGGHSSRLHHSYSYGSISMACFAFGSKAETGISF